MYVIVNNFFLNTAKIQNEQNYVASVFGMLNKRKKKKNKKRMISLYQNTML